MSVWTPPRDSLRSTPTKLLVFLSQARMCSDLSHLIARRFPWLALCATGDKAEALAHMQDADVLVTFGSMLAPKMLSNARRLKWVHSMGTGVDGIIDNPELAQDGIVTATRGIHGPALVEMALLMMLALSRDLPRNMRNQKHGKWDR